MTRLRRLSGYVIRQWPALVAIVPLTIAGAAAVALRPWPMKLLVDFGLGDTGLPQWFEILLGRLGLTASPLTLILLAGIVSLAIFLVSSLLGAALTLAWAGGGQRMVRDLSVDLFHRLQRLSLLYHGRSRVGDSLARLTDDTWCVYAVTNGLLVAPLQQILTFSAMGLAALALDPLLATLAMLMAPLLAWSAVLFGGRLKHRARLDREVRSRLMSFVHQTLEALPLVHAFSTEQRNRLQFDRMADESVSATQRGNLLNSTFGLVNSLVTTTGTALVLVIGGLRVLSGDISLGTLLVFIAYVRSMQAASKSLFTTFAKLKAAEASIDRVFEVMDADEAVREMPNAVSLPRQLEGSVLIDKVTFGYAPGRPVLDNVSLEVSAGETIALVGPSGAGKSTLVALLPRFFDPWIGRILVDGIDLATTRLASLRDKVSVVLQEDFLLPLSIRDNIAYGKPGASLEEVENAAQIACIDDVVRRLPEGYETILGEWGRTLSGGERQRLAIARAVLRDAPLLVLDEPTSALDSETEELLLRGLDRLMHNRTTFIVAHRLSTVRGADRIAFMEAGRFAEIGTHDELMRRGDHYYRLYTAQRFSGATEGVA